MMNGRRSKEVYWCLLHNHRSLTKGFENEATVPLEGLEGCLSHPSNVHPLCFRVKIRPERSLGSVQLTVVIYTPLTTLHEVSSHRFSVWSRDQAHPYRRSDGMAIGSRRQEPHYLTVATNRLVPIQHRRRILQLHVDAALKIPATLGFDRCTLAYESAGLVP